jgi:hypothetical protein
MSGDEASAQGRPVIVEESATIANPDASWQSFGRFVAIDGDWALVQVDRSVPDETSETGTRRDGAAMLFNRSGGTWTSNGLLGPVGVLTEWVDTGLAMKDGVAMVIEDTRRIFERTGARVGCRSLPRHPCRVACRDRTSRSTAVAFWSLSTRLYGPARSTAKAAVYGVARQR